MIPTSTGDTTEVPVVPLSGRPAGVTYRDLPRLAGGQHLILLRPTQLGANLCLFLDLSDAILSLR